MRLHILILAACLPLLVSCGLGPRGISGSDASCVRRAMKIEGWDFDGAMSRCARYTDGHTYGSGIDPLASKLIPFDLRSDLELQAMAENPATNPQRWPYVPRSSAAPKQGAVFVPLH
ncbi:protein-tyrosine phosphatase family protein [Acetobacter sicerae]|uniref:hypothetical protein n=1 Tax=Acetobacter sicerae TaxID=85325 RepID=UPI00156B223A|nr:hypothetical protein [Acetobacter sicerae]NHN93819.1 hypothetical protein [Acetobacter sicerae]